MGTFTMLYISIYALGCPGSLKHVTLRCLPRYVFTRLQ